MSKPIPLVLNTMFRPFVVELQRRGLAHQAILRDSDIDSNGLLEGEYHLPVVSWYDFAERCAEAANDPFFGFKVGYEAALPTLANFELVDLSRGSLGDLLSALILDARRVISAANYKIINDGQWVKVLAERVFRPSKDPAQIDAFYAAYMMNAFRIYSGKRWDPKQLTVWVCDVSAVPVSDLDGVNILPGDRTGADFRFPSSWMLQSAEEIVARAQWAENQRSKRFIVDFQALISTQLGNPSLTLSGVAASMSVSVSTLQRRLSAHGTSFSRLVKETRVEAVKKMLKEGDLTIANIGKRAGFETASGFAKAFRDHTEMTPREYRNSI